MSVQNQFLCVNLFSSVVDSKGYFVVKKVVGNVHIKAFLVSKYVYAFLKSYVLKRFGSTKLQN